MLFELKRLMFHFEDKRSPFASSSLKKEFDIGKLRLFVAGALSLAGLLALSSCAMTPDDSNAVATSRNFLSAVRDIAMHGELGDYQYVSGKIGVEFEKGADKPLYRWGMKFNIISRRYMAKSPSRYYPFLDEKNIIYVETKGNDDNGVFLEVNIRSREKCLTESDLVANLGDGSYSITPKATRVRYDYAAINSSKVAVIYFISPQNQCVERINLDTI